MYEGKSPAGVTYPMKVMKLLGIEAVILTNAAGGLDPAMQVGSVVVLHDHVSLPSLVSTLRASSSLSGYQQPAITCRCGPPSRSTPSSPAEPANPHPYSHPLVRPLRLR